jgi:hypothetical protein
MRLRWPIFRVVFRRVIDGQVKFTFVAHRPFQSFIATLKSLLVNTFTGNTLLISAGLTTGRNFCLLLGMITQVGYFGYPRYPLSVVAA